MKGKEKVAPRKTSIEDNFDDNNENSISIKL